MSMSHGRAARDCLEACAECEKKCLMALARALQRRRRHGKARHLLRLLHCAQICSLNVAFMTNRARILEQNLELCGRTCDALARECEALGDPDSLACAEACRRCAQRCRLLLGTAGWPEQPFRLREHAPVRPLAPTAMDP